ncbi:MAG: arylsulfatase, partial [Planctomycetes bacterium]|nr:arylsulfatase [Planctomycetota bacterium]
MKQSLMLMLLVAAPLASQAPNVVLVITDDQGYGDVGAHGNGIIKTPHLDQLHARSVRLTNFHVDPTCSPTRSALLSGRYSTRTGVWHTIMGRSLMRGSEVTLAETFRANGYRTGMFGKWHLGENAPLRPQDQGFDAAFYHGGGGVGQGPDYWGNDYFDDTYFRRGQPEKVKGYCTDVWFDNAQRFIAADRDKPFFAYLATNAPHGPYFVDKKYSAPYLKAGLTQQMANFYGMITNIDENVGRLVAHLDKLGLTENTLFVFMTDNGTAAGWRPNNSRYTGFNAGMRGAKGSEYDGGHRVPCFFYWPGGKLTGGRDVDQLTAHVDMAPTLQELCGLKRPDGPALDGASLVTALRGDRKVLRSRTLLVHSQRVPDPIKWRKCAVMTEQWRLVNGKQLFDIKADPGQKKDVARTNPKLVTELRSSYESWWTSLSKGFSEPVRIALGTDAEPRTQLHPHDWHVTNQRLSSWHQNHVRNGHMGNGFWALDVTRGGAYEITLRRWPEHEDRPLASKKAYLKIGDVDQSQDVVTGATSVTFKVDLKPGPTR